MWLNNGCKPTQSKRGTGRVWEDGTDGRSLPFILAFLVARLTLCVPWPKCKFYTRKTHPLATLVIKSWFLSQTLWIEFCHNFNLRLGIHVYTDRQRHTFSRTDKPKCCTMSNFKTYVAGLKIFQTYPTLKVIVYVPNIRMYKKAYPVMAFAKISLLSSVIYLFKSYTCMMPGTWYTLNHYQLLTFQKKPVGAIRISDKDYRHFLGKKMLSSL